MSLVRLIASSSFAYRCATPERSATGQVVSWLGTFTDIEDQKRAQEVLAEFKGTLDSVLDAVFIFDPEDWHFLYTNRGCNLMLGRSSEELSGLRPVDFMTELEPAHFAELLAPSGISAAA